MLFFSSSSSCCYKDAIFLRLGLHGHDRGMQITECSIEGWGTPDLLHERGILDPTPHFKNKNPTESQKIKVLCHQDSFTFFLVPYSFQKCLELKTCFAFPFLWNTQLLGVLGAQYRLNKLALRCILGICASGMILCVNLSVSLLVDTALGWEKAFKFQFILGLMQQLLPFNAAASNAC